MAGAQPPITSAEGVKLRARGLGPPPEKLENYAFSWHLGIRFHDFPSCKKSIFFWRTFLVLCNLIAQKQKCFPENSLVNNECLFWGIFWL
jgi:hypothetical protein